MFSTEISDQLMKYDSDDFGDFAWYLKMYRGLSFFNAVIIYCQRPGTNIWLFTEKQWKDRFNRCVKDGAAPIVIIKRDGPVSFLYEPCDTYCAADEKNGALPNYMIQERKNIPRSNDELAYGKCVVNQLKDFLVEYGIVYSESELGERYHGHMRKLDKPMKMDVVLREKYKRTRIVEIETYYSLTVNRKLIDVEKAATMFHEIAHLMAGHVGTTPEHPFLNIKVDRSDVCTFQREVEADTAALLLYKAFGLKNYDKEHLNSNKKLLEEKIREEVGQKEKKVSQEDVDKAVSDAFSDANNNALVVADTIARMAENKHEWKKGAHYNEK